WKEYFSVILGGDQVKSGKPSPDLFLEAANKLDVDPSCCLVLEDSVLGIQAGKTASMQVVVLPSIQSDTDEFSIADYVIHSFLDFQPELWGLPPFDDRVMKALPIEPVHLKGTYKNGFLQGNLDNGESDLPGQVWGVFFGWVDFASQKSFKIVVSISWDSSCGSFSRNIQACFINGSDEQIFNQPMEVALVGYIRGFCTKRNPSTDSQILDQDKTIAEACLNLAAYSYHQVYPCLAFKNLHSVAASNIRLDPLTIQYIHIDLKGWVWLRRMKMVVVNKKINGFFMVLGMGMKTGNGFLVLDEEEHLSEGRGEGGWGDGGG
ncbi:bifunctional riboflavin kinase/FMN phosphatase-like protein, partial [Tanacetum coccineum]